VPQTAVSPAAYPVSIKGVVVRDGQVLLLRNERDEWELPGGRIELGETPQQCVAREIQEETGWAVRTGPVLDSWMYHITVARRHVFIVTYGCHPTHTEKPVLSHEHKEIGLFPESAVAGLRMPEGYRRSITDWFGRLRADAELDQGVPPVSR
jgi:8-oxo-dGTP pyrophosphatase MutT (NUDIX family)